MAIRVTETADSRQFDLDSTESRATWKFIVQGAYPVATYTEQDVYDAVVTEANVPYRWQGMIRSTMTAIAVGGGVWTVSIGYQRPAGYTELPGQGTIGGGTPPPGSPPAPPPPQTPGENDPLNLNCSFEVLSTPRRIFQSVKTVAKYGVIAAVPDHKGAINVTKNGVEGVELPHQPAIIFNLTFDVQFVTRGYLVRLRDTIDKVNKLQWWGYPPHTVLFLGANGNYQKAGRWQVTYKFGLSPTEEAIQISDEILVQTKRGFDYIWVSYDDTVNNGRLVKQPQFAYVEQVYDEIDMGEYLGFGY